MPSTITTIIWVIQPNQTLRDRIHSGALIDAINASVHHSTTSTATILYTLPTTLGESLTARPTRDRGVDYRFVSTVDVEARRHEISKVGYGIRDTWVDLTEEAPEIAPMTVGEVNTRVTELAELHEHVSQCGEDGVYLNNSRYL
ncbi:hypothetical protein Tco_0618589 [Tanacetum coccineum]